MDDGILDELGNDDAVIGDDGDENEPGEDGLPPKEGLGEGVEEEGDLEGEV